MDIGGSISSNGPNLSDVSSLGFLFGYLCDFSVECLTYNIVEHKHVRQRAIFFYLSEHEAARMIVIE